MADESLSMSLSDTMSFSPVDTLQTYHYVYSGEVLPEYPKQVEVRTVAKNITSEELGKLSPIFKEIIESHFYETVQESEKIFSRLNESRSFNDATIPQVDIEV